MRGIGAWGTERCVQMEWNKTTEITDEVSRLLNLQAEMLKHRAFHELPNVQLMSTKTDTAASVSLAVIL